MKNEILEILICPECQHRVVFHEASKKLICESCRLAFSIENNILDMTEGAPVATDKSLKQSDAK